MAIEGYRFALRQPVVLRDLDGFGHVNNAVYLTYVENARVAYLREVVGARTVTEIGNVIAKATLEFLAPIGYPEDVEIGTRVERVGGKSFDLAHRIVRGDGTTVAEARTVQVMWDLERGHAVAVPEEWRRAFVAYDRLD